MTQYRFWKQLASSTKNWKVKLIAWNHMERIEMRSLLTQQSAS